jgi:carbonic anhydrase/acetyltransferase-like protein (isoleucine patch superfamily)
LRVHAGFCAEQVFQKLLRNHLGIYKMSTENRSPYASVVSYQGILPKLHPSVFLACGARVIGDVELGEGCGVWFNAVVRGDVHFIRVGAQTNIQDGAVIHCTYQKNPTSIGNRVSIAHLAVVHGCTIEDDCLIGMGAVILDKAVIGAGSIVGAGTVVSQGVVIPPRSLVLGTPGRVVRAVTDEEFQSISATTMRYLEYIKGYNFSELK